jgi:hypothetical protein
MTDVIVEARQAELLLDWEFNPAQVAMPHSPPQIIEAAGIIPDIFTEACVALEEGPAVALDDLAGAIDAVYGFGGFAVPFEGTITERGVYVSSFDDDPDLPPFVRLIYSNPVGIVCPSLDRFELFVYLYGICALRDRDSRECRIARLA